MHVKFICRKHSEAHQVCLAMFHKELPVFPLIQHYKSQRDMQFSLEFGFAVSELLVGITTHRSKTQ